MPAVARRWWPLALIALAAFWLRVHELDRRPMHWDEANQAVKAGELLESGQYAFDPRDHHGPTLYFAAVPVAWLRGERSLAQLSEATVRLVPAFFGTLSVILIAILAQGLSTRGSNPNGSPPAALPWPAFAAAAFLAVSPPSVYYSRYFIQETLLVTFTLATFVCTRQWWRTRHMGWAVAGGASLGLMQATKASAPLFIFAALLAAWPAVRAARTVNESRGSPLTIGSRRPLGSVLGGLGWAAASALAMAALLYSSFGTNPRGLLDAVGAYVQALDRFGAAASPTGHEKPWWYYLRLFGWQRAGGLTWQQVAFSFLAAAGLVVAAMPGLRGRATNVGVIARNEPGAAGSSALDGPLPIWAAVYSVLIIAALSFFAYKTPWHAVHFVPGMALLAAAALVALCRLQTGKYVAIALALLTTGTLYQQTARAAFLRPADPRNPYAYVHSSSDVLKFRPLAEAALARAPGKPIRIIIENMEYWPLPWYLRGLPNVGYWSEAPADCDGALVIASQATADAVQARLRGNYRASILGLRPGFLAFVYTPEP